MTTRTRNHRQHQPDPIGVLITLLIAYAGTLMASPLQITTEVGRNTPPLLVTILHAGGMTPADWVSVLTLLYLLLQLGLVGQKYLEKIRDWWRGRHGGGR
ncbi:hypothetical protein [Kushneria phosphatilytica]|nr:hypothetical protein [Kushneria phosphatilytica]